MLFVGYFLLFINDSRRVLANFYELSQFIIQ